MTVAESSPGYEIEDPQWSGKTRHEAPPTRGILALYNRGDRRRWYWRCPQCYQPFEPDFHLIQIPDSADHVRSEEHTSELQSRGHLVCRLLLEKKKRRDTRK